MKYPKSLNPGDTITLIAPSFGAASDPYLTRTNAAIRKFNKLGYKVVDGGNVFKAELPYLSNSPELIGKEFMENYPKSNCLLSVGGGELQFETLPYIDFKKISEMEPTWFVGFSDNTNYTLPLLTISEVASIYGSSAGNFGMRNWHQSITDCYDLLTGANYTLKGYPTYQSRYTKYQATHLLGKFHLNKEKILHKIPNESLEFSGRLIGGCIDVIMCHVGTKYDNTLNFLEKYKEDGFIWFLEACDLSAISIRRSLFQLREAGWFKYVKGFLIGRPLRGFNDTDFEIDRFAALDPIKDLGVPIIADFDLGHVKPSMPLILGSYATVKSEENDVEVKMELK